jgi:hypothetical protein
MSRNIPHFACFGPKMDDKKRKFDSGDDIRKILHDSGAVTPHLARLEEVASKMRQVEWTMMRRAAAAAATTAGRTNLPVGE